MSVIADRRDRARCAHPEPIVERIRVRIAEMPGVLRDLVESVVAAQPDLQIVANGSTDPSIESEAVPPADVIVVGVDTIDKVTAFTDRLYAYPHQRVLALALDGRHAVAYELRPHITELGEISPDGLLAAIRAGAPAGAR